LFFGVIGLRRAFSSGGSCLTYDNLSVENPFFLSLILGWTHLQHESNSGGIGLSLQCKLSMV